MTSEVETLKYIHIFICQKEPPGFESALQKHENDEVYRNLEHELANNEASRRAAMRYVLAYEQGIVLPESFQRANYEMIVSVLVHLQRQGIVDANWKERIESDQQALSAAAEVLKKDEIAKLDHESALSDDRVGRLQDADDSWIREREDIAGKQIERITGMDWKALNSKETVGRIFPPTPDASYLVGASLPMPSGSTDIGLHKKQLAALADESPIIPSETDTEQYEKREDDVRIELLLKGKEARRIPMPIDWSMVSVVGDDEMMVAPDPRIPSLVYNLDTPDMRGYIIRKNDNGQEGVHTEALVPSKKEQEYWSQVLPLPDSVRAACEKQRSEIPAKIAAFMQERFRYVCHDGLGAFMTAHAQDLPIIIDELKLGHCNILSYAATAYFRQLGVTAFMTREKVTDPTGKGFYTVGHARVAVVDANNTLGVFDPTAICPAPRSLTPDHLSGHYFEELERRFTQQKSEEDKRTVLRSFLRLVQSVSEETERRFAHEGLADIHADLLPYATWDSRLGNAPSEKIDAQKPVYINEHRIDRPDVMHDMQQQTTDLIGWMRYVEEAQINGDLDGRLFEDQELPYFTGASLDGPITKNQRALIADYVSAYSARQLPLLYSSISGYLLSHSGGKKWKVYDDESYRVSLVEESLSDLSQHMLSCDRKSFFDFVARLQSSKKFAHFVGADYVEDRVYLGDEWFKTMYPGLEQFEFDQEFVSVVQPLFLDKTKDVVLAMRKYCETQKGWLATQYQTGIFLHLAAQALSGDTALRDRLTVKFHVSETFWRDFSESLQPVRTGTPKRTLADPSMVDFRLELDKSRQEELPDYKRLQHIYYVPRQELRTSRRNAQTFFRGITRRSARGGTEHVFDSLVTYTPGDDVRDIDWKASARRTDGTFMVRKRKEMVSHEHPVHIYFDSSEYDGSTHMYFTVKEMVQVLLDQQRSAGQEIYVTSPGHASYLKLDARSHRPDVLASLLVKDPVRGYRDEKVVHLKRALDRKYDLRVLENRKAQIPANLVYISDSDGKLAAVRHTLNKGVRAVSYDEIGATVYPRIKPEWVEHGDKSAATY